MLEPRVLYRTDGKRPDRDTMIPWEMGKRLVWDVTLVDVPTFSRLNQGSFCSVGTTGTEPEAPKQNYRELIDNGCIFQLVAMEVHRKHGLCSRNCERQMRLKKFIICRVLFVKPVYHCSF